GAVSPVGGALADARRERNGVRRAGDQIVLGEIANARGLGLARRNVAREHAVLDRIDPLPGRQAELERKSLAIAAPPLDLHDARYAGVLLQAGERQARGIGEQSLKRLAENLVGSVTEDTLCGRSP